MFILRRENNPDRQGKKSTIGGKRSLFLVYKEDVRGIDWAGVFFFFLSLTFKKSKHKNNKSPPRQITKGTGENESIRKCSTFSFFFAVLFWFPLSAHLSFSSGLQWARKQRNGGNRKPITSADDERA